jgi:fatty acid desaturase
MELCDVHMPGYDAVNVVYWFWPYCEVAHHLFPGVCHVHYPKIAPIIMKVAKVGRCRLTLSNSS